MVIFCTTEIFLQDSHHTRISVVIFDNLSSYIAQNLLPLLNFHIFYQLFLFCSFNALVLSFEVAKRALRRFSVTVEWKKSARQTNAATICKKLREDYFVFIHFSFIPYSVCVCFVRCWKELIERRVLAVVVAHCNEK